MYISFNIYVSCIAPVQKCLDLIFKYIKKLYFTIIFDNEMLSLSNMRYENEIYKLFNFVKH